MAKGGASFRRDRAFLAREAERSASTRPESVVCSRRYELGLGPAHIPCIFLLPDSSDPHVGPTAAPTNGGTLAVGVGSLAVALVMLQTPDGNGRLELFEYIHPAAIETEPTRPNEIGMHRVAFSVDDIDEALQIAARHGCHPLRGVATYEDVYKLTYVRGPSGIIVMLAEELNKS